MSAAAGWAVVRDGQIDLRTVGDTRRAALVNWLVAHCGIMVFADTSDRKIEEAWRKLSGIYKAEAVPVTVTAPVRSVG